MSNYTGTETTTVVEEKWDPDTREWVKVSRVVTTVVYQNEAAS